MHRVSKRSPEESTACTELEGAGAMGSRFDRTERASDEGFSSSPPPPDISLSQAFSDVHTCRLTSTTRRCRSVVRGCTMRVIRGLNRY